MAKHKRRGKPLGSLLGSRELFSQAKTNSTAVAVARELSASLANLLKSCGYLENEIYHHQFNLVIGEHHPGIPVLVRSA